MRSLSSVPRSRVRRRRSSSFRARRAKPWNRPAARREPRPSASATASRRRSHRSWPADAAGRPRSKPRRRRGSRSRWREASDESKTRPIPLPFLGELASEPLDFNHPLWTVHIVEKYEGGAAVVFRWHHAIADGVALVRVSMAFVDGPVGESRRAAPPDEDEGWL